MKQYLHTIMRSLCIIVMLCGISNGAWADFSEGDGSQDSRWVITQDTWEEFASNYGSTTEYYFQLGENIVLSEVSTTLDITSEYLDMNSYSITVGSDSYDLSFPDTFCPLFSSDLENYVTYYFSIESDDELSSFINQHEALSKDNVNIMLTNSVAAPDDFEQITEFEGHFDGGSESSNTITMPDCNIKDFIPLFSKDCSNVENVQYAVSITISDLEGLNELKEKVSYWSEICQSYIIKPENGSIELDNDWAPIDNSNEKTISFEYQCQEGEYIIFPSYAVSDFSSNGIKTLLSSNTDIESCFRYSELTISDEDDITYLGDSSNSNLLAACQKLTLTADLDYSDMTSDDFSSNVTPLDFSGEVDLNGYTIKMPPINVTDDSLPVLFTGRDDITYDYGGISINEADELLAFANNQDKWRGVSVSIDSDITLTGFPTESISENFEISVGSSSIYVNNGSTDNYLDFEDYVPVFANTTLNNAVVYSLEISSQADMEKFCQYANDFDDSDYISLSPNSDKGSNWYDYDMSSTDLTGSSRSFDDLSEEIIILATDKSYGHEPFTNSNNYIQYFYTPSYELIDVLFNNIVTTPSNRGVFFTEHEDDPEHTIGKIADFAGHGTESSPYQIYNYEMLKKLVELIDGGLDTEGMYIQLASDINAQGNERLTDVDGNTTLDGYDTETLQFPDAFKGHFDGDNHSIAGLTLPLFSSLDGATVKNLGIVDCYMTGTALATSANNTTVTKSYVSGVSNGLVSEDGNTVEDCYAYNPSLDESNRYTTSSTFNAETVEDISKTHYILKDNCYKLGSKYSDCTLFIPEDNTFYNVSPSNTFFTWNTSISDASSYTYMYYVNLGSDFVWIDNPVKSNASMLHNVLYRDGWLNNNTTDGVVYDNVGSLRSLDYLYSWYIVDKKNCDVSNLKKYDNSSNELGMCCRVNNIYYSRNNASTTSPSPDGLNTIYLPFAWNPTTDVYDSDGNPMGDDVEVYILADKLSESGGEYAFDDDALYKDYSKEKSLLFFDPANKIDATHTTKYDNFAGVSNALPTLLNIPSGESGWYIKRSGLANYFAPRGDGGSYDKGLDNLYNNYWEDQDNGSADNQKIGRSFMEIDRLGEEWNSYENKSNYTYKYYHSIDDMSSNCTDGSYWNPVTEMNRDEKEVYDSYVSSVVTIYKAPESNAIAVDGAIYPIIIKGRDADENEIELYNTDSDDRIVLDSDGYPAILYAYDEKVKVVINYNYGTIKIYTPDGNGGYTSSSDPISVEFELDSKYPLLSCFYVCGGHEDGYWYDQSDASDFPGRAYHLGTFSGLAAGTFDNGKIASKSYYSGYKLNSAGDGFAKVTDKSSVQPFRTFFAIAKGVGDIDTGTPSEAKAFRFGFCGIFDGDDTPTEIDNIPVQGIHLMTTAQSRVYSLDGRYVGQYGQKKLARGMYIMNGRKFVVK